MLDNYKEMAEVLKLLANENRLQIVCHLIDHKLTVSEMHERLSHISQPALSQHLSILKANKILDSHKQGLTMTYFIQDHRIIDIIKTLKSSYCE